MLFGANLALILALVIVIAFQGLPLRASAGWEYKDVVANLLTVVTVVLTFIGLAVALAAIWGWQTISQGAASQAAKGATDRVDSYLEDEAFKSKLAILIKEQYENMQKADVQDVVIAEQSVTAAPDGSTADEEWNDDDD